jgi:tol-pal system protein YbgF
MMKSAFSMRAGRRCAFALVWASCCFSAQAGLFEDDEARRAILEVRQRVEQAQVAITGLTQENAQLRRSLLDFLGQIEGLKAELSQGRGAHERLAKDLSDVQIQHKDTLKSLEERFRAVEVRLRALEPQKVSLDGADFMAEPAEKRDFEAALDIFRKGDFVAAQASLSQFVQRHRGSGYAPAALFWLGNAQYVNKDYKEAQANFQRMLSLAPAHPKAAEAMLAISNIQTELKDLKGARKTLDELIKNHPTSETATTARERLARMR